MATRTRFVFLMHPKEWKQEKAATGRLTHLCLANSVIHVGVGFDEHTEVQRLISDPDNFPVLLYPGTRALNLTSGDLGSDLIGARRLVVFLLDATWSLGRKMLRSSPSLQRLPQIMFTPVAPSRYIIKQQPHPGCLSTLEATHEVLLALERSGLDAYAQPAQLLDLFARMQDFQLRCASNPPAGSYRPTTPRAPSVRRLFRGESARRRANFFRAPTATAEDGSFKPWPVLA